MNVLDWLIAGILVLSVVQAAAQGFVFELFSLAGTVFGYLLAAWEYPAVARYIAPYVKSDAGCRRRGFFADLYGGSHFGRALPGELRDGRPKAWGCDGLTGCWAEPSGLCAARWS